MTPKRKEEIREWAEGFAQFQPFPTPRDRAIAELLAALGEAAQQLDDAYDKIQSLNCDGMVCGECIACQDGKRIDLSREVVEAARYAPAVLTPGRPNKVRDAIQKALNRYDEVEDRR